MIFADVYRDGTGVIEFTRYEHMKRALRDLDYSKFRSHEVCVRFKMRGVSRLDSHSTTGGDVTYPDKGTTFFWFTLSLTFRFPVTKTQP